MAFAALYSLLRIGQVLSRQLRPYILRTVKAIVVVALFSAPEVPFRQVNLQLTNLTLDLSAVKQDQSAHRLVLDLHHVAVLAKDAHFDLRASDHLL